MKNKKAKFEGFRISDFKEVKKLIIREQYPFDLNYFLLSDLKLVNLPNKFVENKANRSFNWESFILNLIQDQIIELILANKLNLYLEKRSNRILKFFEGIEQFSLSSENLDKLNPNWIVNSIVSSFEINKKTDQIKIKKLINSLINIYLKKDQIYPFQEIGLNILKSNSKGNDWLKIDKEKLRKFYTVKTEWILEFDETISKSIKIELIDREEFIRSAIRGDRNFYKFQMKLNEILKMVIKSKEALK